MMAKSPELNLKPEETLQFAKAIAEAQKHFPIPVLDPKWAAVGGLCTTAFVIHKRMLTDVNDRKAREKNGATRNEPPSIGNVPMAQTSPEIEAAPWFNLGAGPPN